VRERRILGVRLMDYLRKDDDRLPFHSTTICIFYTLILYYEVKKCKRPRLLKKWSRVLVAFQILTGHGHSRCSPVASVYVFLSAHLRRSHTLWEPRSRTSGQSIHTFLHGLRWD
jgi:hypothetical protein